MSLKANFIFNKLTAIVISTIGLAGASVTIYAFFFQEKQINLQYEIMANSNVLDVKADISKLDIIYGGSSLKDKNENLRIINLKVVNTGSEHILNTFYDDNDPLGFRVNEGAIIEIPEVLDASNEYLRKNIVISVDSLNRVKFSKVIFESNEFFILKLLVLHKSYSNPTITSLGKVAGIKGIDVVNKIEFLEKQSFFKEVFGGNTLVQVAKAFSYFLIAVLAIIGVVGISVAISNLKDKRKRRKILATFLAESDNEFSRMDDVIFERYKKDGAQIIRIICDLLNAEKKLNERYQDWLKKRKEFAKERDPEVLDKLHVFQTLLPFNQMIKDGILVKQKANQLTINQPMKKTIEAFTEFLKEKGELKEDSSRSKHLHLSINSTEKK